MNTAIRYTKPDDIDQVFLTADQYDLYQYTIPVLSGPDVPPRLAIERLCADINAAINKTDESGYRIEPINVLKLQLFQNEADLVVRVLVGTRKSQTKVSL